MKMRDCPAECGTVDTYGAIRSEHIDNNLQSNPRTSFLLESPSARNCEETDSILTSVKANREMQLWPVRYLVGNSYFRPAQSSKPFDRGDRVWLSHFLHY